MEKERKSIIPAASRYPLFMAGLLVLLLGEFGATASGAPLEVKGIIAALGFILLVLSVLP